MDNLEAFGFYISVVIALVLGNLIVTSPSLAVVYFLGRTGLTSYFMIGAVIIGGIGLLTGWLAVSIMSAFDITGSKKMFAAALIPILVLIVIFAGGLSIAKLRPLMEHMGQVTASSPAPLFMFPDITESQVIIISIVYYIAFFAMTARSLIGEKNAKCLIWSPTLVLFWFVIYFLSRFFVNLVMNGTLGR